MIALYIIFGIYYVINLIIFTIIHYKKTNKNELNDSNYNRMISLFNDTNTSVSEPLLNEFV